MDMIKEFISSIPEREGWTKKQKLDELLRIDCRMYTNLGTDSSEAERKATKDMSRFIYNVIRKVDQEIGDQLISAIDC